MNIVLVVINILFHFCLGPWFCMHLPSTVIGWGCPASLLRSTWLGCCASTWKFTVFTSMIYLSVWNPNCFESSCEIIGQGGVKQPGTTIDLLTWLMAEVCQLKWKLTSTTAPGAILLRWKLAKKIAGWQSSPPGPWMGMASTNRLWTIFRKSAWFGGVLWIVTALGIDQWLGQRLVLGVRAVDWNTGVKRASPVGYSHTVHRTTTLTPENKESNVAYFSFTQGLCWGQEVSFQDLWSALCHQYWLACMLSKPVAKTQTVFQGTTLCNWEWVWTSTISWALRLFKV